MARSSSVTRMGIPYLEVRGQLGDRSFIALFDRLPQLLRQLLPLPGFVVSDAWWEERWHRERQGLNPREVVELDPHRLGRLALGLLRLALAPTAAAEAILVLLAPVVEQLELLLGELRAVPRLAGQVEREQIAFASPTAVAASTETVRIEEDRGAVGARNIGFSAR